jgi:hypothetical protein
MKEKIFKFSVLCVDVTEYWQGLCSSICKMNTRTNMMARSYQRSRNGSSVTVRHMVDGRVTIMIVVSFFV